MRECKRCGASYRGLVCQACHPRGSGTRAQLRVSTPEEIRARFRGGGDVAAAVDVGGELAGGAVLAEAPVPGDVSPVKTDGEA